MGWPFLLARAEFEKRWLGETALRRRSSPGVNTLKRKSRSYSLAERFGSTASRILPIRLERGRDFQAGVTTRRIRQFSTPTGSQKTLKGLPFGTTALTTLWMRAEAFIYHSQISNDKPWKSRGKVFQRYSVGVLWPSNAVPASNCRPGLQRSP